MRTNIKNHISSTLFKLLKDKNIEEITISEIVRNIHISRSTFYNNFNNVIDVLNYKLEIIVNNIYNLYYLNNIRKKDLSIFCMQLLNYIKNNINDFYIIKKHFFNIFKEKLDNKFMKHINTSKYIIKSGSIFNIIYLYLDNKINDETLLFILNNIN